MLANEWWCLGLGSVVRAVLALGLALVGLVLVLVLSLQNEDGACRRRAAAAAAASVCGCTLGEHWRLSCLAWGDSDGALESRPGPAFSFSFSAVAVMLANDDSDA